MARPALTLVRNGNVRQSSAEFEAENLRFRIEVARLAAFEDAARLGAACERLSQLCRSINTAIRTLDLERDEAVGDSCFAARVRIAELGREAVLRRTPQAFRASRRALHASLAFLLMTVAPVLAPARSSTRATRSPLKELAEVTGAALRENPADAAWLVELAETELILAESMRGFSKLERDTTWRLLQLQSGIDDWNRNGRTDAAAANLVESLILVLDAARE